MINKGKKIIKNYTSTPAYEFLSWIKNMVVKYYAIHCYKRIDGWITLNEAIALYDIARSLKNMNPRVVELGSWQGKSTFILYKGLNKKQLAEIYCIDPFNADGDCRSKIQYKSKESKKDCSLKDQFLQNCAIYKMNRFVKLLEGYSYEFSKEWNLPIDFLFIDANHSEKAVYQDYLEWSNFVAKGGYIAFHDVLFDEKNGAWSGPGKIFNSYLIKDNRFVLHKYIDSLLVAKRL